jgi:hypothetical protein
MLFLGPALPRTACPTQGEEERQSLQAGQKPHLYLFSSFLSALYELCVRTFFSSYFRSFANMSRVTSATPFSLM